MENRNTQIGWWERKKFAMISDIFKYKSKMRHDVTQQELQKIQNNICDEKSKDIYSNCLLYSVLKDTYYIKNLILSTTEGKRLYKVLIEAQGPVIIFGAGLRGKRLANIFEDISWAGFVDNNCKDKEYRGIPIVKLSVAQEKWKDALYVISPLFNCDDIKAQLLEAGIKQENILIIEKYNEELGKKMYINSEYIQYEKLQTFVDCGGYNGNDTEKFLDKKKNGRVYLFEPDVGMFKYCQKRFLGNQNVIMYSIGVGSERKNVGFERNGGGLSAISIKGKELITIDALDNLISEDVDFVKMDIEGSEADALNGARNIIRRCRPKLAISIYHQEEDIWRLPLKLLEYDESYQFEFQHYSIGQVDTVMYAF